LKQLSEQAAASQGMLFPEMLELSVAQASVMETLLDDFLHLGFDISNMGGGTFAIQGVPEGIAGLNPTKLVTDMLACAMEKGSMAKEEIHRGMAITMARSSALVVGEVLSTEEMGVLIEELFKCEMPSYTPEGKKVFVIIEDGNIDEMFSK
jgi:DNA mismatch repair protein MutL